MQDQQPFGLLLDNLQFVHALQGYGVMASQMADTTYAKRLDAVYRPTTA